MDKNYLSWMKDSKEERRKEEQEKKERKKEKVGGIRTRTETRKRTHYYTQHSKHPTTQKPTNYNAERQDGFDLIFAPIRSFQMRRTADQPLGQCSPHALGQYNPIGYLSVRIYDLAP